MNNLSWLIYIAGVTGNIQGLLLSGSIIALILMAIVFCVLSATIADGYGEDDGLPKLNQQRSLILKWTAAPISALVLACILPSSGTVYAIAASEVGEDVLASPTGSKAVKALDAWLDRQIAPPAPAKAE